MQDGNQERRLFDRWKSRLAQALLREPSVVLIDRDAASASHAPLTGSAEPASPEKMH